MDLNLLEQINDFEWRIAQQNNMKVPAILFASRELITAMDVKVYEQISNVAALPGIIQAAYAMPDAHLGYGFPIGGVAAFDPEHNGVICAGGVGFDISCGVRLLKTGLTREAIDPIKAELADALFAGIPSGVGSQSAIHLKPQQIDDMLVGGAHWAVTQGYGEKRDLEYIEENGQMKGALSENVSETAKKRQKKEMGTLGSGNHYLEVQAVAEIYDETAAKAFGLFENDIVISIHCGSRGLGHQVGTDYMALMLQEAKQHGIHLPDKELACAPIQSTLGQQYLGAMRAGINCALANRQIITYFVRNVFQTILPRAEIELIYDVSHNTCKEEWHEINKQKRLLYVHRKGATRAFAPHHAELPDTYKEVGQPVIIGGSMGTASYVLTGINASEQKSFSSACHGAGRAMSRNEAARRWKGKKLIQELEQQNIFIRSDSYRGVAEEAPDAYKDVHEVIDATHKAGLAKKVARLVPLVCVKG